MRATIADMARKIGPPAARKKLQRKDHRGKSDRARLWELSLMRDENHSFILHRDLMVPASAAPPSSLINVVDNGVDRPIAWRGCPQHR
jgi:hypothetical protein